MAEPPEITFRRPPLFTVALKSLPPMTISVPPLEIIVLIVVPPDRTFATPPLRRSRPALVWPEETMIIWPPLTTVRGRTLKLSSANQPLRIRRRYCHGERFGAERHRARKFTSIAVERQPIGGAAPLDPPAV